jgi:hypothetical protein
MLRPCELYIARRVQALDFFVYHLVGQKISCHLVLLYQFVDRYAEKPRYPCDTVNRRGRFIPSFNRSVPEIANLLYCFNRHSLRFAKRFNFVYYQTVASFP